MASQFDLAAIQAALATQDIDGWLFFDHHLRDPLAYRILRFDPPQTPTRRWYYFVPRTGQPVKISHRIESKMLSALPGRDLHYSSWREQRTQLAETLDAVQKVAMQYSPECAIPYVSMVDAGTVELIRNFGVEIVTSAELIQTFEACWTQEQFESHLAAGVKVDAIRRAAFQQIDAALRSGRAITEFDIKTFILTAFEREGLFTDHGPIVAANAHASDPHYEPAPPTASPIAMGDTVLIDMWAKLRRERAVYYDITWTAFCGASPPAEVQNVFRVVTGARDAAIRAVETAMSAGTRLRGCDVDDAARGVIASAGFGDYFIHRTGHSIGEDVHGTGANMDNLETHDERSIVPRTCFSIEPGIYLPSFGIRSEVNVYVSERSAEVTGEIQQNLVTIGA